jgi:DNA-binding XRE family transcriptional regulator
MMAVAVSMPKQNTLPITEVSMAINDFQELQAVLSDNIKQLRAARGLAQERLGLESGVDRTMVSKVERRIANPTLEMLVKLANTLEVTVPDLLTKQR